MNFLNREEERRAYQRSGRRHGYAPTPHYQTFDRGELELWGSLIVQKIAKSRKPSKMPIKNIFAYNLSRQTSPQKFTSNFSKQVPVARVFRRIGQCELKPSKVEIHTIPPNGCSIVFFNRLFLSTNIFCDLSVQQCSDYKQAWVVGSNSNTELHTARVRSDTAYVTSREVYHACDAIQQPEHTCPASSRAREANQNWIVEPRHSHKIHTTHWAAKLQRSTKGHMK